MIYVFRDELLPHMQDATCELEGIVLHSIAENHQRHVTAEVAVPR
jgi:hypothetical protein